MNRKYPFITYSIGIPNEVIFIIIQLLLWSTTQAANTTMEMTGIRMRKTSPPSSGSITIKGKFADLITNNDVFVDKTMLIKVLLEYQDKFIIITRPRKWGKSTNLEMIKSFVEVHIDRKTNKIQPRQQSPNYRLFKHGELPFSNGESLKLERPLMVAKHEEFLEQNVAQYLVIHASFKEWKGSNYDRLIYSFYELMTAIFVEHNYLLEVLRKISEDPKTSTERKDLASKDYDKFIKIRGKMDYRMVEKKGLHFLSRILHDYLGKSVIILIDDYDYPLIQTLLEIGDDCSFTENEKREFIKFYHKFLINAIQDNVYVSKVILTGVHRLLKEDRLHVSTNIPKRGGIDNRFFQFYGFTRGDVDKLLDHREVSDEIRDKFHDMYDGYESHLPWSWKIYNPYSVMNFLRYNEIQDYWLQTDTVNEEKNKIPVMGFTAKAINEAPSLRIDIESLKEHGEWCIHEDNLHFHAEDCIELKNILNQNNFRLEHYDNVDFTRINAKTEKAISDQMADLALSYLWAHGYLTFSHNPESKLVQALGLKNPKSNTNLVWFRAPNKEIWEGSEIKKHLSSYYKEDKELMFEDADLKCPQLLEWRKYIHGDRNESGNNALQFLERVCERYGYVNGIDILLYAEVPAYENFKEMFRSRIDHHPDIMYYKQDRVEVIKVTLNESSEKALAILKQYEPVLKQSRIAPKIKLVGVNAGENWGIRSYDLSSS